MSSASRPPDAEVEAAASDSEPQAQPGSSDSDEFLLARAVADTDPTSGPGLFADGSVIRRLSAENAVVMGGGCALLLEVAHPLVAAGVARHSEFRRDPLDRLRRTLEAISTIVFEDRARACAAVRRIERAHARVEGRLGQATPRFGEDEVYSARSQPLLLWVWATLVWTTLQIHDRLVAPVATADRETFHREHAVVARLLGVPDSGVPRSAGDFDAYFARMLESELWVTDEAREVASSILAPAVPLPGVGLVRALTTALLPEALREAYGLTWSAADAGRLEQLAAQVKALRRPQPS
jgi:uncharacterized protein (DUF2236 family)